MQGYMGVSDLCFSVPTVVGRGGVEKLVEIVLSEDEKAAMMNSASLLKETLKQVQ